MRAKRRPGVVAGLAADLMLSMVDAPGSGFSPNSAVACLITLERGGSRTSNWFVSAATLFDQIRTTPEIEAAGLVDSACTTRSRSTTNGTNRRSVPQPSVTMYKPRSMSSANSTNRRRHDG